MDSATERKYCATCRKTGDVFTCRGCRKAFCSKHIDEHRQKLAKEVENLAEELELLRNDVSKDEEVENIIAFVKRWEEDSIAKICLTAETIRTDLQQWVDRNNIEVKIPIERITNELRSCQETDDYTEIDIRKWIQQLEEYRCKIEKLPFINTDNNKDSENIYLLKLQEPPEEIMAIPMDHSTPSLDITAVSTHEEINTLVREKFNDVVGAAAILEDGLVVKYSGSWLGDSSALGINAYSTGVHHIRFRIMEKFYDPPFFGIINSLQKNSKRILESVSANGWWNFDVPVINGEKEQNIGKDKILRPLDDLTLTLDCDREQIFLKHHRTKRLLYLPIDLRACPFPWKILVILHRRGDSVRIVGGTLNLTRGDLASRISEKRKI